MIFGKEKNSFFSFSIFSYFKLFLLFEKALCSGSTLIYSISVPETDDSSPLFKLALIDGTSDGCSVGKGKDTELTLSRPLGDKPCDDPRIIKRRLNESFHSD